MSPTLVALGNPLLDILVNDGEKLLEKYNLKANDAILAEGDQLKIYDDLRANYPVSYVAGGSGQNTARGAQYLLPADSVAYFGSVGSDSLADQLREANDKEGVQSAYYITKEVATGACAVVVTGSDRSLVTSLGAAEKFSPAHFETEASKALIAGAKYFYLEGFFLTHGLESALVLAKAAAAAGKVFAMNLSAPFLVQFFKANVDEILPYVDILIGNESEALAFSEAHEYGTTDLAEIAKKIVSFKKIHSRPRVVVVTQGADATIVATATMASPEPTTKVFPVDKLAASEIVDTNGAGDAFAGGFMAAYILGKSVDKSVEVGHAMGQMVVKEAGAQYKWIEKDGKLTKVDVLAA